MDKIVALCKRRGFIFPSSEIYGGIGSTLRLRPLRRPAEAQRQGRVVARDAQERDDIVALDSAILQHPRVVGGLAATSPASPTRSSTAAPAGSASAPTTSTELAVPAQAVQAPGRGARVRPHRGARVQPHVRDDDRPGEGRGLDRLPAPRDRAGHLHQLQERAAVRAQEAAVRHRPGRQVVPQRDHARATSSSARASSSRWRWSSSSRPARRSSWFEHWMRGAHATGTCDLGHPPRPPAPARARRRRALPLLDRHERRRVPLPDRLVGARGHRQPRRLRPHPARAALAARSSSTSTPASGERYVPHVIEPAAGVDRATLAFLVDAYDEEEVGGEQRTVLQLHPRLAPVKVAVLPLVRKDGQPELAREVYDALRAPAAGRVRRGRLDRPALPPPGRDRHAVRA